jgi:hypothetical protein
MKVNAGKQFLNALVDEGTDLVTQFNEKGTIPHWAEYGFFVEHVV